MQANGNHRHARFAVQSQIPADQRRDRAGAGGYRAGDDAPISGLGKQYFEETPGRKKGIVSAPLKSELSGSPVVLVTAPLLDDKGNVAPILAGAIELQRTAFLRQIDLLERGKTGFVFFLT